MIHALSTDDFLTAVQEFDRHARLGQQQVLGPSARKRGWSVARPWNPLHLHARAARLSNQPMWRSRGRGLHLRTGLYPQMGAPESALAVCHDLYEFAHELAEAGDVHGACFVAMFKGPAVLGGVHFERLLWRQLQTMRGVDAQYFDEAEPPGALDAVIHVSLGGRAYAVVGQHPGSGALDWPALAFYPAQDARR